MRIPENVLSDLSSGNTPAYTVRVSMPHPNAGGENVRLSALAWIIVQAPPPRQADTAPEHLPQGYRRRRQYRLVGGNTTEGAPLQPTLTITRVTEDNTTHEVASERLSGTSGSYSLSLWSVEAGNLKDTYQVVLLSVENPGEDFLSTDSFPLYVDDADALKVQNDKGDTISALTMDNTSRSAAPCPPIQLKFCSCARRAIEYIGINYDEYGWNSFKDGIQWLSQRTTMPFPSTTSRRTV